MARLDNIVYVDENEVFFLIHLEPDDEKMLMDGLRDLGIEAEGKIIYCG